MFFYIRTLKSTYSDPAIMLSPKLANIVPSSKLHFTCTVKDLSSKINCSMITFFSPGSDKVKLNYTPSPATLQFPSNQFSDQNDTLRIGCKCMDSQITQFSSLKVTNLCSKEASLRKCDSCLLYTSPSPRD